MHAYMRAHTAPTYLFSSLKYLYAFWSSVRKEKASLMYACVLVANARWLICARAALMRLPWGPPEVGGCAGARPLRSSMEEGAVLCNDRTASDLRHAQRSTRQAKGSAIRPFFT